MENWLSNIALIIEIILGLGAIIGFLWGGFVWIIRPIKNLVTQTKLNSENNIKLIKAFDEQIIPFIKSMTYQFSENSGKSIKDQLNRIDDSLRLGELRSKMLSNSLTTHGAYECDLDGDCTWVNNALSDLFGIPKEDMLGRGWLAGVKSDDRERVWHDWTTAISNDYPFECEYIVVNQRTRREMKVRATAIAHKGLDGEVLGYYGTLFPI